MTPVAGRAWAGLLLAFGVVAAAARPARAAAATAVALENALPGDTGWKLAHPAADGQLEAYLDEASVARGEAVHVHARADVPGTLAWTLYRMGHYGGAEGRRVASGGPVPVGPQPTPAAAPGTGLVECRWPVTFTVQTDPAWTSGVYLFVLTRDDGLQRHAIFVLRDDARRGAGVFQASFTTYQAYNRWGGRSSYSGFAPEISYDRPFAEGDGAGQYFRFEHDFVRWAESRGYDLVYVTDLDMDRDAGLLSGQRLFLSVGHDEYWTRAAREHLEAALAAGVNAAFLSSNAVYWHIRLEPSRADPSRPRRTQVCYKTLFASDPMVGTPLVTVQFRDPLLAWPENALVGVMYSGWNEAEAPPASWIVRSAGHWVYEGTGVKDGDAIPGIVGYEVDRVADNGQTPPGLVVLARSPYPLADGTLGTHEAAVHVRPSGAFVFATGSNDFSWGLSRPGVADARVQRMMENVLRRAGLEPSTASDPTTQQPSPDPTPSGGGSVGTSARGGCASGGEGACAAIALLAGVEAIFRARRRAAGSRGGQG
jgi:N,N-dimethylformamidase beta subunit-like protein